MERMRTSGAAGMSMEGSLCCSEVAAGSSCCPHDLHSMGCLQLRDFVHLSSGILSASFATSAVPWRHLWCPLPTAAGLSCFPHPLPPASAPGARAVAGWSDTKAAALSYFPLLLSRFFCIPSLFDETFPPILFLDEMFPPSSFG